MAENYTLNVQDTASVEAWKEKANDLNQRAARAVQEAGQALNEFKDTAEGNVFEEVCKYSDSVISGMTKVLEGMNEILTAVNSIMDKIRQTMQDLVGGVGDLVGSVFGG